MSCALGPRSQRCSTHRHKRNARGLLRCSFQTKRKKVYAEYHLALPPSAPSCSTTTSSLLLYHHQLPLARPAAPVCTVFSFLLWRLRVFLVLFFECCCYLSSFLFHSFYYTSYNDLCCTSWPPISGTFVSTVLSFSHFLNVFSPFTSSLSRSLLILILIFILIPPCLQLTASTLSRP